MGHRFCCQCGRWYGQDHVTQSQDSWTDREVGHADTFMYMGLSSIPKADRRLRKTPCCMLSTVQENKEFGGELEVS